MSQHAHEWMSMGPIRMVDGHQVGIDFCSCFAARGTVAGEEYVFPPIGVYTPKLAEALGTIIGAWAVATIRRNRRS